MGYPANTKGYRIALPSGKVIISDDVIFAEDIARNQKPLGDVSGSRASREPEILEVELGSPQEAGAEPADPGDHNSSVDDADEDDGDGESEQDDDPGPGPAPAPGPCPGSRTSRQAAGAPAQHRSPSRVRSGPVNW